MPEPFQPPFRNRLSCVIFDIDGTIARSNDLIFESFNHVAFRYLGKRLTNKEIIGLFGPPEEGALGRLLGQDLVAPAMEDLCNYYVQRHDDMAALHPGIEQMLSFLKSQNIPLAVFTGKGNRTTTITLEKLGVHRLFDKIVTGSDVRFHKPHPEGILTVLNCFQLEPHEVLMVGDSVSDVRAARGAGVSVASVLWDAYDRSGVLKQNADYVFHTVEAMMGWFRSHRWESKHGVWGAD